MDDSGRLFGVIGPLGVLVAVGCAFLFLGAVQVVLLLGRGAPPEETLIDFCLIGLPGFGLLYGTYRLVRADIAPAVYWSVVRWVFGGLLVMLAVVGLLVLNPAGNVDRPLRAVAIAAGLGGVGGVLIGTNEARALTRAHEAERRNRELEQAQAELEEAIDRLEQSNERLEQFAYAASHDLQEPLRMVSSYLQLLERRHGDELDEDGQEYLSFAVAGADRMRGMVESLLEYSRVETEGDSFEPVDLEAVFADAHRSLRMKVAETGATVSAEPLPTVEGDRDQLLQVFQQLLDNALVYSGDEPPRVQVSAEQAGDEWVISVADEGPGIHPREQDQVFEVFERLHTPEDHPGSGIGLALCERIVERHGGEIWVESTPGEGATFSFTLPVEADASALTEPRQ